jgi:HPt (histidine-containing phosphotransfer) domain-containing protein
LTANVGDDFAKRYFDAGFKGYLKKPLEQAAMVSELSFWLKPSTLDVAGAIVSGEMLFNSDVVEELIKQIGNENYLHVRSLFIDESQSRITSLSNAWLRRDLEKVRKEAHALSSSVASFGCEDLSWRLKKIEAAACLGDATEIVRYMTDIDSASKDALGIVLQYGESEEPTNR